MQITSCEIANNKYIQIYLTEEELEKQDRLDDIELSIIKNKEGEKGKITLKRKLLVFTEKENENNKINDKKLW